MSGKNKEFVVKIKILIKKKCKKKSVKGKKKKNGGLGGQRLTR